MILKQVFRAAFFLSLCAAFVWAFDNSLPQQVNSTEQFDQLESVQTTEESFSLTNSLEVKPQKKKWFYKYKTIRYTTISSNEVVTLSAHFTGIAANFCIIDYLADGQFDRAYIINEALDIGEDFVRVTYFTDMNCETKSGRKETFRNTYLEKKYSYLSPYIDFIYEHSYHNLSPDDMLPLPHGVEYAVNLTFNNYSSCNEAENISNAIIFYAYLQNICYPVTYWAVPSVNSVFGFPYVRVFEIGVPLGGQIHCAVLEKYSYTQRLPDTCSLPIFLERYQYPIDAFDEGIRPGYEGEIIRDAMKRNITGKNPHFVVAEQETIEQRYLKWQLIKYDAIPSASPTAVPTTTPTTFQPTIIPSIVPSMEPTQSPTFEPSYEPTTSRPSRSDYLLHSYQFSVEQRLFGISAISFISDYVLNRVVFAATVADLLGLKVNNIRNISVSTLAPIISYTTNSHSSNHINDNYNYNMVVSIMHYLSQRKVPLQATVIENCLVKYRIVYNTALLDPKYDNQPQLVYNNLRNKLLVAVNTTTFAQTLYQNALEKGASTMTKNITTAAKLSVSDYTPSFYLLTESTDTLDVRTVTYTSVFGSFIVVSWMLVCMLYWRKLRDKCHNNNQILPVNVDNTGFSHTDNNSIDNDSLNGSIENHFDENDAANHLSSMDPSGISGNSNTNIDHHINNDVVSINSEPSALSDDNFEELTRNSSNINLHFSDINNSNNNSNIISNNNTTEKVDFINEEKSENNDIFVDKTDFSDDDKVVYLPTRIKPQANKTSILRLKPQPSAAVPQQREIPYQEECQNKKNETSSDVQLFDIENAE